MDMNIETKFNIGDRIEYERGIDDKSCTFIIDYLTIIVEDPSLPPLIIYSGMGDDGTRYSCTELQARTAQSKAEKLANEIDFWMCYTIIPDRVKWIEITEPVYGKE